MHFFYLDEAGCTGVDLDNDQQPIFVLGGLSVRDGGWLKTKEEFEGILSQFFDGNIPQNFELHTNEMVNLQGAFAGRSRQDVSDLVFRILQMLETRKHPVHFSAIDKGKMRASLANGVPAHQVVDCRTPYLVAFNYMIMCIEDYIRNNLGKTARGLMIIDHKENYEESVRKIVEYRRFEIPKTRQLKRIVEFTYPVDSKRHPMIQLSDFVIFLVKKFLEIESGYKPNIPTDAKNFYARCYDLIMSRMKRKGLIEISGREDRCAHDLLRQANAMPSGNWRRNYQI